MRRSRKLLGIGAAVAGAAAITVPVAFALAESGSGSNGRGDIPHADTPTGEVSCEIEKLEEVGDGGGSGMAEAVSSDGAYIVGDSGGDPVLWHEGKAEKLPEDLSYAVDVNSSGVVVGVSENMDGDSKSFVYRDGELEELAGPDGGSVEVTGINDDGAISGNAGTRGDEMLPPTTPVKWESGETKATELELSDGLVGETTGIAADGTVVGNQYKDSEEDDATDRPWIWDAEGKGTELAEGAKGAAPEQVRGEWAMSLSAEGDGPYRWNVADPSKVEQLDVPKKLEANQFDVDGRAYGSVEADGFTLPAAQHGDKVTELPVLVDKPDGEATSSNIGDVSDDGSLLVGDTVSDEDPDSTRPVVWNCS